MDSRPTAKVILDSASPTGIRLTTMEVKIHRFVLAELNTHRVFCLAGDSQLYFDLPRGPSHLPSARRLFKMPIAEFVDKWYHGAAPRANNGGRGTNRQPIQKRLAGMSIRQLDETTGLIQLSQVTDCWFSGVKDVYEVKAGKHLVAGSADHRIYTPQGYRTIGELNAGDEIIVQRKGKSADDYADNMRFKKIGGQWRSAWQTHQRARLFALYGGCEKCSSTDSLSIHHIIEVCIDPSLAFEESNILLLCGACHDDQHRSQHWQAGQYLVGDAVTVDRVSFRGQEDTFDLEIAGDFPNFIANGVVVHNSRNSASSRAIPVKKQIDRVLDDPAMPMHWGANEPGMQANEELSAWGIKRSEEIWLEARDDAVWHAERLNRLGLHKQVINRLLEPFMWHTVIISSTEWVNFWQQRCTKFSPLAQPEMRAAADAMYDAYQASYPSRLDWGVWHMPYLRGEDLRNYRMDTLKKVSAARCARVSYLTHDGKRDIQADLDLYEKLVSAVPRHESPLEHVATPARLIGAAPGNFVGWAQLRHLV